MKILLADDNHFYRLALEGTLKDWGYEVISVADGNAALAVLLSPEAPKVAILDWTMPQVDGVQVCRQVRAVSRPEPTYIIMLTAKGGKENIIAALDAGADDYVTKPFDREELQARLRVGLRIVGLQTSETVIFTLARAVEAKSPFTQGHSERVMARAVALADRLGLSPFEREVLRKGALVHDIGKISIHDDILNKSGALTDQEYEIIKTHPAKGESIVRPLQALADVIPLILWHHERLDGSGYPDGLRDGQIPLLVRILAIADSYDAMASARPYRPPLEHGECIARLRKDAAKGRLDPALVELFCQTIEPSPAFSALCAHGSSDQPVFPSVRLPAP